MGISILKISKEHQQFLESMSIDLERVKTIDLDIQILIDITKDYNSTETQEELLDSAELIAKKIQRCKQVHSVRWRVKDTSHLIEKIIRKKESNNEKYIDINVTNYKSKLDDLIGVRAIYLFKHDWLPVHQHILSRWTPKENVVVYYREGDDLEQYLQPDCETKKHHDSYRSIHYIVPATEKLTCEVQTRTIFEEAWSEIDHKVRYPNFSDNPHLKQFLNIFNRLAGSADEMGSYVISLTELINSLSIANKIVETHKEEINKLEIKLAKQIEHAENLEEIKKVHSELQIAKNKEHEAIKQQMHQAKIMSPFLAQRAHLLIEELATKNEAITSIIKSQACIPDMLPAYHLHEFYKK